MNDVTMLDLGSRLYFYMLGAVMELMMDLET